MTHVASISEFLLQAGTQYRLYDMGRSIRKLNSQQFLELENGQRPYPYPRQQLAWIGVVFWNKNLSEQHYIWFIKLPLDEKGFIVAAHRDQFMAIIVEALGQELQHTESKQGQLPENPYTFVPAQQQLADFNAISRRDLKQPASSFYHTAQQYMAAPQVMDWTGNNWLYRALLILLLVCRKVIISNCYYLNGNTYQKLYNTPY